MHDLSGRAPSSSSSLTSGRYCAGSRSSSSRNTPSAVIFAERLPVGRARHRDGHRARRAVARQPDHAHVVAEVLAAELGADADRCCVSSSTCCLELEVAEAAAELVARTSAACRGSGPTRTSRSSARTPPTCRRSRRRGGTADTRRCRACAASRRGTRISALGVEERLGLLEQEALVGRAAALGHEQELVRVAVGRRRARSAPAGSCRCSSRPTCERRHLRVAQVGVRRRCRRCRGRARPRRRRRR